MSEREHVQTFPVEKRVTNVVEGENLNLFVPCGAWCFIFGLVGLDAHARPIGCFERKGHDVATSKTPATPHKTQIESFGSPKAHFEVTWTVE